MPASLYAAIKIYCIKHLLEHANMSSGFILNARNNIKNQNIDRLLVYCQILKLGRTCNIAFITSAVNEISLVSLNFTTVPLVLMFLTSLQLEYTDTHWLCFALYPRSFVEIGCQVEHFVETFLKSIRSRLMLHIIVNYTNGISI